MFKQFINNHFNTILIVSMLLGLLIPGIPSTPIELVPVFLGTIIFTSFFKLDLDRSSLTQNIRKTIAFYVLRFLLFPVVCYFVIREFSEFYALVVFIFYLLPSGVSAPALSGIYGANVSLSLTTVIFSSFLSILIIPFLGGYLIGTDMPLDRISMFKTLFFTIGLPFLIHLPIRRSKKIKNMMVENYSTVAVLCLSSINFLVMAANRTTVLADLFKLFEFVVVGLLMFGVLYVFGWNVLRKSSLEDRLSFAFCSGLNNVGLGITIGVMYFPTTISTFFIITGLAWIGILTPVKLWLGKKAPKAQQ